MTKRQGVDLKENGEIEKKQDLNKIKTKMEALSIQKREVLSDQKRETTAKLMKEDKRR